MHTSFRTVVIAAFLVGRLEVPAHAQAPARDRHVVVISLDGFPAYALRDPKIPLLVMRRLIREGGVADGMKTVNPTVTWPNHTAMVTGVSPAGHGVLFNGLGVREGDGKPLHVNGRAPKNELVQARTVYDAAHDAGLTTAEVAWVAINQALSIDWSFAEGSPAGGALAREMVAQGAITDAELQAYSRSSPIYHDEMRVRAAEYLIEKHRPNLLLMHLATTDDLQHQYGGRSRGGETALVLADRQIQRVLDAIDHAGIRDTTTVLVVSDHGFRAYQHRIYINALLRQKGLIRGSEGQVDCDAWTVTEGGTAYVYVTRESRREATLKALKEAFANLPGVARVVLPDEYGALGYPAVTSQGRMSDLVLDALPGYAFLDRPTTGEPVVDIPPGGETGTHGYLNSDPDMDAILVAWGAGIEPRSHTGTIPNVNVAATIAQLLKLKFTGAQGTPLLDLLKK